MVCSFKEYSSDVHDLRSELGVFEQFVEVFDVGDLPGLCNSMTFLFETFVGVEFHGLPGALKNSRVKQEATNESASAAFAVVAMNDGN